jgi:putative hydrolase of the HAD superfamily
VPEQGPKTGEHAAAGVRAVCLDVDDTLVDHSASSRGALRLLLGHDNAWPLWQQITDEHVARVVAGVIDSDTMLWQRTKEFFGCLGELLDDGEAIRRESVRVRAMREGWTLFDDTLPCLEWLTAVGVKIAVITNASGPYQRAKLANLGVARYIDEVVIAGELGAAKPDPVIFRTACARLGYQPAEVVHVGDRLDLDAIGARDAGMVGVWLNRTGPAGGALPSDVAMITSLELLPELLVCDLDLVLR